MFRAIKEYDGSDTSKCICLGFGDTLTAVHAVDDTWFIGYNERTGETGAFPINCVEKSNEYSELPDKRDDDPSPYANVSQSIQDRKVQELSDLDPLQRSRTLSNQANKFDANRLRSTKPEKSFQLKQNDNDDIDERYNSNEDRAVVDNTDVFDIHYDDANKKSGTLQKVRFEDVKVEHSLSVPESMLSWQESFEQSYESGHHEVNMADSKTTADKSKSKNKKDEGKYHKLKKEKLKALKASTDKLFHSDKEENKGLKAVFGAVAGFVIGGLMYVVLYFSFGYTALEAGIIVIFSTLIMSICLAISSLCRCIMALVFPNFFTGKGRAVFLSIIFGVIISNPIANIAYNAKETGSSMACIVELAANQTRALQGQLAQPVKEVAEYVERQTRDLKAAGSEINAAFGDVRSALNEMDAGVDDALKGVLDLVKQCRDPITAVVNECNKGCNIPLIRTICQNECSKIFEVAKGCDELKKVGVDLTDVSRKTRDSLDRAVNFFTVDMSVNGDFSGDVNTSTSVSAIQDEVNKDISSKASAFEAFIFVAKKGLSLSLGLIFFQAFWYIRNYLAKDGYDNLYITKQFKQLDKDNVQQGREAILPLKKKENGIYVVTSSWTLNTSELAYCKLGLVQVLLHFLLCLLVIIFDYTLYYILNLVKQFGDIELTAQGEGQLTININGTGPVAEFYRLMVGDLNLNQVYTASLDIDHCLPNPKTPAAGMIPILLLLYIIALLFVILRGYGMRLRRKISAYYYPEQERARLDYLHKKIRHKRVGFLKFLRQQIKSSHKEGLVKEKLRLSTWLAFRFPMLASCLPNRSKLECSSCEQREGGFHGVTLTKCPGDAEGMSCDAVYCHECSLALGNTCPLCTQDEVVLRD